MSKTSTEADNPEESSLGQIPLTHADGDENSGGQVKRPFPFVQLIAAFGVVVALSIVMRFLPMNVDKAAWVLAALSLILFFCDAYETGQQLRNCPEYIDRMPLSDWLRLVIPWGLTGVTIALLFQNVAG